MPVKKTTTKKKTTKKVVKNTSSGKFTSKESAKTDKAGTVTQTVPIDKDGVRSDKGGTHQRREPKKDSTQADENAAQASDINQDLIEEVGNTGFEQNEDIPQDALETDSDGALERKPCLIRRPTKAPDYTCLDEIQEAVENPHHFTETQVNVILNEENLCDNCREYNENA